MATAPSLRLNSTAVLADISAVVLFVLIRRRSHEEGSGAAAVVTTAIPFLIGLALGWLMTRMWTNPLSLNRGVGLVALTVAAGMVVRRVTHTGGTPLSFVIVTSLFLVLFLLGWRALVRVRNRRASDTLRA